MRQRSTPAILFWALVAGCVGGDDAPEVHTATTTAALAGTPAISIDDSFIAFQPGLYGYDLNGGSTSNRQEFTNFGVTNKSASPTHDIVPHDDAPDLKRRVRLTLLPTVAGNPSGDVTVYGRTYERNWVNPLLPPSSLPVQETLHFSTHQTKTTSVYFDQITSIETEVAGLGVNSTLRVEWWDGHEQEMAVGIVITNIADETTCESDWRVYFNGQTAYPDWDPNLGRCTAGLYPGAVMVDGQLVNNSAYRGLYFGLMFDEHAEDAYHHFENPTDDPADPYGHTASAGTWLSWWAGLGSGASLFVAYPETFLRPIVVHLERQSDLHVTDAARVLMTIRTGANGNPALVPKLAGVENPGAIAQLSPRGLDRLEPTHAATMLYPIVPAGTQPRLSERAIDLPAHTSDAVDVDLAALPEEDFAYWTEPNPDRNGKQFAGYLAYLDIKAAAGTTHDSFEAALLACRANPQTQAICENLVRTSYCVQHEPDANDFRIRIEGIQTYFDPQRPEEALTVGDVTNMDLSFGTNQVLADFTLEDIEGWLEASIDPANIFIEWDKPALDPCFIKPAARPLSDFVTGAEDYQSWLTCRDLTFSAGSGTLGNPIPFDIDPSGEKLLTSFAPGLPSVDLTATGADPGPNICGDEWLDDTIVEAIEGWETDVEAAIAAELVTSPGQDEALDRLLSPYELGIEHVTDPPVGTPEYDVHPLATYSLSAKIAKTGSDTRFPGGDATDGLYVPYNTRSSPVGSIPYLTWFCPMINGQSCDGLLDQHAMLLEGGLAPDGAPFDVSVAYTTAHINQALWAQARRSDKLGSPTEPARLTMPTTAIVSLATALGYTDLTAALAPFGTSFGIRFHQEAAPYTVINDVPQQLVYVTPNIIVELVAIAADGTETVIAKVLVDVVDRDHELAFSTGGVPELTARWGQLEILSMTSTFLPGCDGARTGVSCNSHLLAVIGALWWPQVGPRLLDLIEHAPGLHRFDAGQESGKPRHLESVRTFLQEESVVLVGDLCKPGTAGCP